MMETERIKLRPWRDEDAEALFKHASDPEVGPRAGWPPHKSASESLEIIRTLFNSDHIWAIELKESGEPIGCVGYMLHGESNINIGRDDAEVGYWVARPHWNRGICTEALRLVARHCFNVKGFSTLWADYLPENPASGRVMEKCGFRDTGAVNRCSRLQVGSDHPVKIMRLDNPITIKKNIMTRKHWIDNLRWVTVLLVLLYHVVYFYNNKGVFGGVGGFGDSPQYQDALMYVLYPWFMPLLFILAGISAHYSLEKRTEKEWFRSRTLKLLVPSTVGLLVFQWMTGYFNTLVAGRGEVLDGAPFLARYIMCAVSGIGPLWFIQDLWLFSLVLVLIRRITKNRHIRIKNKKVKSCLNDPFVVWPLLCLLGVPFWLGTQTLVMNPRPDSLDGLYNLYKPFFYIIPFLFGYYIFSSAKVQKFLTNTAWWGDAILAALGSGLVLFLTFGEDNTTPQYLSSVLNCAYGWLMCLAMMGLFAARFDRTNRFAGYMTRSSFGLYIVHYLVIASLGYMMYRHTQLPPAAMYAILTVAVFALSPLLYELLRRIPVVRWCVLGEKKNKC